MSNNFNAFSHSLTPVSQFSNDNKNINLNSMNGINGINGISGINNHQFAPTNYYYTNTNDNTATNIGNNTNNNNLYNLNQLSNIPYNLNHNINSSMISNIQSPIRKRAFSKRSKSGCLTCRKRRIKCDEIKPICNNCDKSKRCCVFPSIEQINKKRKRRRNKKFVSSISSSSSSNSTVSSSSIPSYPYFSSNTNNNVSTSTTTTATTTANNNNNNNNSINNNDPIDYSKNYQQLILPPIDTCITSNMNHLNYQRNYIHGYTDQLHPYLGIPNFINNVNSNTSTTNNSNNSYNHNNNSNPIITTASNNIVNINPLPTDYNKFGKADNFSYPI